MLPPILNLFMKSGANIHRPSSAAESEGVRPIGLCAFRGPTSSLSQGLIGIALPNRGCCEGRPYWFLAWTLFWMMDGLRCTIPNEVLSTCALRPFGKPLRYIYQTENDMFVET
jgi:hypothetical protein